MSTRSNAPTVRRSPHSPADAAHHLLTPRFTLRTALAAAVALAASACADATAPNARAAAEPAAGPRLAVAGSNGHAKGLLRATPLAKSVTRRLTVGPTGGTFPVAGTGLTIVAPANAVRETLTITVTAYAGKMVAYDFQPHGTVFARPLVLMQDIATTGYGALAARAGVEAGYFADPAQLDLANNSAAVNEFLAVSADARTLSFNVQHFSGYMLSSGRTTRR